MDSDNQKQDSLPEGAMNRLQRLVGSTGLERLSRARVAVFGLGAVGSFAVEGLARSGIGHLRLVDFDNVKPSNLNRQLYALTDTMGRPKVQVARERVGLINPNISVDCRPTFFSNENEDLLEGHLDFVVDAIDSLCPKVTLLRRSVELGIPVISCMGAANRTDPSKVRISQLSDTNSCPLARKVRRRLRRQGIVDGITVVWSAEVPRHPPSSPEEAITSPEHDPSWRGRIRGILPSMAPLPGIFGLSAANHVIWSLLSNEDASKAL